MESVLACDRVVVMDQGRVVEQGPPSELLRDGASHFARMHRAQRQPPTDLGSSQQTLQFRSNR